MEKPFFSLILHKKTVFRVPLNTADKNVEKHWVYYLPLVCCRHNPVDFLIIVNKVLPKKKKKSIFFREKISY
jgi:hypothetical protein